MFVFSFTQYRRNQSLIGVCVSFFFWALLLIMQNISISGNINYGQYRCASKTKILQSKNKHANYYFTCADSQYHSQYETKNLDHHRNGLWTMKVNPIEFFCGEWNKRNKWKCIALQWNAIQWNSTCSMWSGEEKKKKEEEEVICNHI